MVCIIIYLAPCFQRFPCHSTDYTRLQMISRNGRILWFLSFLCYCVFITDCLHCDFFQEARKAQLENHEPEDEEEDMDKETQDSGQLLTYNFYWLFYPLPRIGWGKTLMILFYYLFFFVGLSNIVLEIRDGLGGELPEHFL